MKSLLKKVFRKMGITFYKTRHIPIGVEPLMDIQNHFGKNISCVFDVGANTGQTVSRIKAAIPTATLYAFEPIKATHDELVFNTKNFTNTYIENIGFGSEKGVLNIGIAKNSLWNSFKNKPNAENTISNETVIVETVDNYVTEHGIERINFLKIDVEGYEIPVLMGAKTTILNNQIDFIYCEVGINTEDTYHTPFMEVKNLLSECNFKFVAFYDHSLINSDAHYANALFFNANILTFR